MRTLEKTKKPATKVRRSPLRPITATRTPPPVKNTLGDIAKIKDFGKGLDGALVEKIVADRHL